MGLKLFEKNFLQHIKKEGLFEQGDKVLVGLSGGSDSVALLLLLIKVAPVLMIEVAAVHCNYQLRTSSFKDEAFCAELALSKNVPFFRAVFDTNEEAKVQKKSIEDTARRLRYTFFEQVANENGYTKVATAHHADDNVETILFNLFRGSSVWALQGIPKKRQNIIRPLLSYRKEELLTYLAQKNQPYVQDETNFSSDYDRNFIRNQLIPLINERFADKLYRSLSNFSDTVSEFSLFAEEEVSKVAEVAIKGNEVSIAELKKVSPFIQKELFKRMLMQNHLPVNAKMLLQMVSLIDKQNGKQIEMSKSIIAKRSRDAIVVILC